MVGQTAKGDARIRAEKAVQEYPGAVGLRALEDTQHQILLLLTMPNCNFLQVESMDCKEEDVGGINTLASKTCFIHVLMWILESLWNRSQNSYSIWRVWNLPGQ